MWRLSARPPGTPARPSGPQTCARAHPGLGAAGGARDLSHFPEPTPARPPPAQPVGPVPRVRVPQLPPPRGRGAGRGRGRLLKGRGGGRRPQATSWGRRGLRLRRRHPRKAAAPDCCYPNPCTRRRGSRLRRLSPAEPQALRHQRPPAAPPAPRTRAGANRACPRRRNLEGTDPGPLRSAGEVGSQPDASGGRPCARHRHLLVGFRKPSVEPAESAHK